MSNTTLPTLPDELRDLIVRSVPLNPARPSIWGIIECVEQREIRNGLWNYAMASRTNLEQAYPLLFSSVIIEVIIRNLQSAISELRELCSVLDRSNSVRRRVFGFVQGMKTFSLVIIRCKPLSPGRLNWIMDQGRLPTIFNSLYGTEYGIESLSMCFLKTQWNYADSNSEFQHAFKNLLCSPRLRHLQLDGVVNLPQNLLHGTRIRKAEFYNLSFNPEVVELSNMSPVVESLGLDDIFLRPGEILPTIRYLATAGLKEAYFRLKSWRSILDVIDSTVRAAGSLERLRVDVFSRTHLPDEDLVFYFTNITNLAYLHISDKAATVEENSSIIRVLKICTFPPTIQNLTVEVTYDIGLSSPFDVDGVPIQGWSVLDALFEQTKLTSIPTITIVIIYLISIRRNNGPLFNEGAFEEGMRQRFFILLPQFSRGRLWTLEVRAKARDEAAEDDAMSQGSRQCVVVRHGGRDTLQVPLYSESR